MALSSCRDAWLPIYIMRAFIVLSSTCSLRCRRKKFTFAISSPDEILVFSMYYAYEFHNKLENVAIAMHCNLRLPYAAPAFHAIITTPMP